VSYRTDFAACRRFTRPQSVRRTAVRTENSFTRFAISAAYERRISSYRAISERITKGTGRNLSNITRFPHVGAVRTVQCSME